jgi:hypothetical protein
MLQQKAGSSGEPLRGPVASSKPAAQISAKGKDEPVVQNLPEAKPKTTLLGVSNTDTPLQGDSTRSLWSTWTPVWRRRPCLDAQDGR